jgi:prepilin-type N-terminal cleavage/methylation domain-containing protein
MLSASLGRQSSNHISGFTLVELSIVLVIIGLIVGGVIGGQSLVRSAYVNSIVRDIKSVEVALNNFELQYDAKPGDMIDADQYWSAATNGDGNNYIYGAELNFFWEHLNESELFSNEYSGFLMSGDDYVFSVLAGDSRGANADENLIVIYKSVVGDLILTPREVFSIDKKMDDGLPLKGYIGAWGSGTADGCLVGNNYDLTNDTFGCQVWFYLYGARHGG